MIVENIVSELKYYILCKIINELEQSGNLMRYYIRNSRKYDIDVDLHFNNCREITFKIKVGYSNTTIITIIKDATKILDYMDNQEEYFNNYKSVHKVIYEYSWNANRYDISIIVNALKKLVDHYIEMCI